MIRKYCEKYDAYFDSISGRWLEETCGDENCEYCKDRPEKHTPHKWTFIEGKEEVCG